MKAHNFEWTKNVLFFCNFSFFWNFFEMALTFLFFNIFWWNLRRNASTMFLSLLKNFRKEFQFRKNIFSDIFLFKFSKFFWKKSKKKSRKKTFFSKKLFFVKSPKNRFKTFLGSGKSFWNLWDFFGKYFSFFSFRAETQRFFWGRNKKFDNISRKIEKC